jgi:predicted alpha/beta hydrolase
LLITFTDDGFATQAGEARLKRLFATLKTIEWNIHPKETGMRRIGHFGFFRRQAQEILWPRVLAYLSEVKSATATD